MTTETPQPDAKATLLNSLREAKLLRDDGQQDKWRLSVGNALNQFMETGENKRIPQWLKVWLSTQYGVQLDEVTKWRQYAKRNAAESEMATAMAPKEEEKEEEPGESGPQPGKEIEPVIEGEVVEPLGEEEARELDTQIRDLAQQINRDRAALEDLVDQARNGQVHEVLGFSSWTAYLADALAGQFHQVDVVERREAVVVLLDRGVSNHVAAQILGVTEGTVRNDLKALGAQNYAPPEDVDGRDGTKQKRKKKQSQPVEPETDDETDELDTKSAGATGAESASENPGPESSESETDETDDETETDSVEAGPESGHRQPIQYIDATQLSPEATVGMHLRGAATCVRGASTVLKACVDPAAVRAFSKGTDLIEVLLDAFDHDAELVLAKLETGEART